jgi:cytochrome b561
MSGDDEGLKREKARIDQLKEHGKEQAKSQATLEKVLLTLLFAVPGTGLLLIAGGTDWLPVHVTAQVVFLAMISVHVGLVLKHTVVQRNRHLRRIR